MQDNTHSLHKNTNEAEEDPEFLINESNHLTDSQTQIDLSFVNSNLKQQFNVHLKSGYDIMIESNKLMQSQIDLLVILKQAKAPLYLFDQIWKWTQQSANSYNIDFSLVENVSRVKCLKTLKDSFNIHGLEPRKKSIILKGSNKPIDLIIHDFEHSLYSLLSDETLMHPDNLLISINNDSNSQTKSKKPIINDIDTGSVYQQANNLYINAANNELLCPIIFFIDKTHTDVQGRLCLEQIRFTLGIFNRQTRNNPNAWRTLGYIADQAYIRTKNTYEKNLDYHHMISVILHDFKLMQKQLIE
jgi:hypothetical protein